MGNKQVGTQHDLSQSLPIFSESDFKRQQLLGSGGFGQVGKYSVENKTIIDRDYVAIKFLKHSGNTLENEANLHCRLQHQNIVEIFGVVESSTSCGIVMELVEGGTLRTLLRGSHFLSDETVLVLSQQLADGLSYLHNEAQMVHADLKPEDILLTKNREVKISDFGLAARLPGLVMQSSVHLTVHLHGGTRNYMAPEFEPGMQANMAIDMWSFGVVLSEMMENVPPQQPISYASQLVNKTAKSCLQKEPSRRATSMEASNNLRCGPAQV